MTGQTSIEIVAGSVEEAIEQGLEQLGVGPSQVIVEVIEEPSRGLFGIGAKQARVRLQLLAPPPPPMPPKAKEPEITVPRSAAPASASTPAPKQEKEEVIAHDDDFFDDDGSYGEDADGKMIQRRSHRGPRTEERGERDRKRGPRQQRRPREGRPPRESESVSEESTVETPPMVFAENAIDVDIARQVLTEMMEIMELDAAVNPYRSEPSDKDGDEGPPWVLNVDGENLSELIGRRGETLSALQYLTRLIVSKQIESRANIIVDVDNYRNSRSDKLEKLAQRMADQAVETNRTVTMEPMPPHERRIIHMVLREREDVETESKGQGDERRVTIVPKRKQMW